MDKAELAQIRALLQANCGVDGPRPRKARLAPLLTLLRPKAAAAAPRPALAPPRRVGACPTTAVEGDDALVLSPPLDSGGQAAFAARRNAFGQRSEPAFELSPPLRLPAPAAVATVDQRDVGEALRRLGSVLAPAATSWERVAEAPYHPEDFADPAAEQTDRLYAAAGLVEIEAPAAQPRRLRLQPDPPPAPAPEHELLTHLERVCMAERAGLEARRLES